MTARDRIVRQALDHYRDWVITHEIDPELAPVADLFITEFTILNAHSPEIQAMWTAYATEAGIAGGEG